jgi:hypothetical protein
MIVRLQRHIWRRRLKSRELAVHYFRYGRALLRGRARYIGGRMPLCETTLNCREAVKGVRCGISPAHRLRPTEERSE